MEIDYTVGAELEFYICSLDGENIADLASGKFPQKRFDIAPEYKERVSNFIDELAAAGYHIDLESGPGQFEVQFPPFADKAVLAAKTLRFKEISQEIALGHQLLVTFAAKPFDEYTGNGFHVHYCSSIFDPYGLQANNGAMQARRDAENKYVLWAIGGMLSRIKPHNAIFFPTQQSFKRIEPFFNAPTKICWGRNNRSCAVRIPDSKPKRIEHRIAGADASPKAVIDAVIADAEYGINKRIEPGEPIFGNAWDGQYERESIV